jgi:hypothetical protein
MKRADLKRFVYINFMMKRINDASDRIYESLADSDEEGIEAAIEEMGAICAELLESVSDVDNAKDKA